MFRKAHWLAKLTRTRRPIRRRRRGYRPLAELLETRTAPAVITVNTTSDDLTPGDVTVSLREAITAMNNGSELGDPDVTAQNPGVFGQNDTINFNIPGAGVHTINLTSVLPRIDDSVDINGYSQPGASRNSLPAGPHGLSLGDNAVLLIELNGSGVTNGPFGPAGLYIHASNCVVEGLVINRFYHYGIVIEGPSGAASVTNDMIRGNFIGTDPTGEIAEGNSTGILINGGRATTIGGNSPADANLISGNNYLADLGNGGGIGVDSVSGGFDVISGNYIGTDATGIHTLGNINGVWIFSAAESVTGNLISGNQFAGIILQVGYQADVNFVTTSEGNFSAVVQGNLIGTDPNGTLVEGLGNVIGVYSVTANANDVYLLGGNTNGDGNIIAGNTSLGLRLGSQYTAVEGNTFQNNGILIDGSNNMIGGTGSAVNTFVGNGIFIQNSSGNRVVGNSFSGLSGGGGVTIWGPNATGNTTSSCTIIGGDGVSIINGASGNSVSSCSLQSSNSSIDGDHNTFTSNTFDSAGVHVSGSCNSLISNTFSGNDYAIYLTDSAYKNLLQANLISASTIDGIYIAGTGDTVTAVPYNGSPAGSITGSGQYGIFLASGGNNNMPAPVLTKALAFGNHTLIMGTLASKAGQTVHLEFFANAVANPNGGEGQTFLGAADVRISNYGRFVVATGLAAVPAEQPYISATATDAAGNTSPFAADITVNVLHPSGLQGFAFEDFNNDGQIDFGENGISGVSVRVQGTDVFGQSIDQTVTTDTDGSYQFTGLLEGTYTIAATQPSGYSQGINTFGTSGGSVSGDVFTVNLGDGVDGMNYNFGERPVNDGPVQHGQTAQIGFWNNKNGQSLIKSLNSGVGATQLGNWLASTFVNLFGANAGNNNLAGLTNAQVAAAFQQKFVAKGQKLDAQVMATALAVYVTNEPLAGNVATAYGFDVTHDGVGAATFNVGNDGAAIGQANGATMSILDILLATDTLSKNDNGVLYGGDAAKRSAAFDMYSAVNVAGSI